MSRYSFQGTPSTVAIILVRDLLQSESSVNVNSIGLPSDTGETACTNGGVIMLVCYSLLIPSLSLGFR